MVDHDPVESVVFERELVYHGGVEGDTAFLLGLRQFPSGHLQHPLVQIHRFDPAGVPEQSLRVAAGAAPRVQYGSLVQRGRRLGHTPDDDLHSNRLPRLIVVFGGLRIVLVAAHRTPFLVLPTVGLLPLVYFTE